MNCCVHIANFAVFDQHTTLRIVVQARFIHRLKNSCLVNCFELWQENTKEQMCMKAKSARIIHRLKNSCLVDCFELWQENTKEQMCMKLLLESCRPCCLSLVVTSRSRAARSAARSGAERSDAVRCGAMQFQGKKGFWNRETCH